LIRTTLTDAQREIIAPHCLARECDPGRTGPDPRLFVGAVPWIARTGCPWRDLLSEFGGWNTAFKRFRRWVNSDAFYCIFRALYEDADFRHTVIDGTVTKVHRHGQGARGGTESQAIGRSRGGMTSKTMALTDALGNLIDVCLLPGKAHDPREAASIEAVDFHRMRRPARCRPGRSRLRQAWQSRRPP
jgi:transposase